MDPHIYETLTGTRPLVKPFTGRFRGRCQGCSKEYGPGETLVSPGKGRGAYHPACYDGPIDHG